MERLESRMSDSDYGSSYDDEDVSYDLGTENKDLASLTDQDSDVNSGDDSKEKTIEGERKIKIVGELKPQRIKKKKKLINFISHARKCLPLLTQDQVTHLLCGKEDKKVLIKLFQLFKVQDLNQKDFYIVKIIM